MALFSSLQDVFSTELTNNGTAIKEVPNLFVATLDPIQAAADYRESVISPLNIVITMSCNVACPYLPSEKRTDWGLEDPSGKDDAAFIETIRTIEERILELRKEVLSESL